MPTFNTQHYECGKCGHYSFVDASELVLKKEAPLYDDRDYDVLAPLVISRKNVYKCAKCGEVLKRGES